MNEQRIPAGDAAAVRLHRVAGDLNVKSWNEQDIGLARQSRVCARRRRG